MNKEKHLRKTSSDPIHDSLPSPPPPPPPPLSGAEQKILPDAYLRLLDYKNREKEFLKNLNESIEMDCKRLKSESDKRKDDQQNKQTLPNLKNENIYESDMNVKNVNCSSSSSSSVGGCAIGKSECELLREECESFLRPFLNRTGPSITAALVTNDAFEQLNRLHKLLDQMLAYQEQNYQMRKYLRDIRTLSDLKKLQKKDSSELLHECDISETEFDVENNASLWNTILAAGNSASNKRNSAKRQRERSKSVIGDDISLFVDKDIINSRPSLISPRRQSVFSEGKAKISKWTKVKAAFKWERANVLALNEGKSLDSGIGLTPVNTEVARYLRVPAPIPCTGSSGDSVLSGGSIPPTPGTISSASSIEDVGCASEEMRRDSSKSDSRCDSHINIEEENRRSRSLDGDMILSHVGQNKSKTPWKKVKNIIQTHKGSFKGKGRSRSIKSNTSEKESRDASPCASLDAFDSSAQTSPTQKNQPHHLDETYKSQPTSPNNASPALLFVDDNIDSKMSKTSPNKLIRKSKIVSGFESLPEDAIIDNKQKKKSTTRPPPSPLNLSVKMDSSDAELFSSSYSPTIFLKSPNKLLRYKKQLASGNSSVPSSPSRNSEFFGEFESEDMSSGDFSEPTTPLRKFSDKMSFEAQKEEINEKYLELKEKLNQEFENKRQEWDKIRSACCSATSCAYHLISKEESNKNITPMLEENLSADFKKKLHKWRVKKQISTTTSIKAEPISPNKESDTKKIDWNLWKTGQIKLDGQGLTPLPDQKNLPEEFQKKLEQWKKMKDTNTVPSYQNNNSESLRRSSGKFGMSIKLDGSKKHKHDDDNKNDKDKQNRTERDKNKMNEKDKLEKLSKLKAIVTDPRAKEIEVQTSVGIMKFEGISRKFTRKLYEWEKARGIGPESSTFALLHPGYRPLDVGKVPKDNRNYENCPNLGRSFSLDSISPNPSLMSISHQTSSLSLNNVSDMKENGGNLADRKVASNPEMDDLNQQDEPEAVIVEVEDDIIETAAPLVTILPKAEHQTPIYKYEEVACNDFCARKYEHVADNSDKLCDMTFENVHKVTAYLDEHKDNFMENIRYVMKILNSLNASMPELEKKIWRENNSDSKNAMVVVKKLVTELLKQLKELNEDAACCQETINERTAAIEKNLKTLQISINLVCEYVKNLFKDSTKIPKINVTSDECNEKNVATVSITPSIFQPEVIVNHQSDKTLTTSTLDSSEFSLNTSPPSQPDYSETSSGKKINRNASNGSKKKTRLRKMGSRQNSKTESDSSNDDNIPSVVLESQRRIKRRPSRNKKSFDDDKNELENLDEGFGNNDDVVYVLKLKPCHSLDQEKIPNNQNNELDKILISPQESCVQLLSASQENLTSSANIFIKTKRKIFTTVNPNSSNSNLKTFLTKELESSQSTSSELPDKEISKENKKNLPPIPQSPNHQRRQLEHHKSNTKELSPSIKMMIAKYNQNLESPMSSGTCTPSSMRSPVLERRNVIDRTNKYEQKLDKVQKSASANNINYENNLVLIDIHIESTDKKHKRLSKSYSADVLPWKNIQALHENSCSIDQEECLDSLAWDSLKKIHKNVERPTFPMPEKKEHIFRKNKEKPTSLMVGKIGASKKIDLKNKNFDYVWRRSVSNGDTDMTNFPLQPNKSDNTIPRITRKLEGKAITPTEKSHPKSGDLWHPTVSMPQVSQADQPKTPLTERAKKLQRAKERFLQYTPVKSSSIQESDEIWLATKHRGSQMSTSSETSIDNNCALLKSASVGMIATADEGDENNRKEIVDGYESLPRNVARSGKISSKLGFASLASKFRKVKIRSGHKDQNRPPKLNAVSTLCRQSLLLDINAVTQEPINQNLSKSKSSHTTGFGTLFKHKDKENLNKSKSSQNFINEKK